MTLVDITVLDLQDFTWATKLSNEVVELLRTYFEDFVSATANPTTVQTLYDYIEMKDIPIGIFHHWPYMSLDLVDSLAIEETETVDANPFWNDLLDIEKFINDGIAKDKIVVIYENTISGILNIGEFDNENKIREFFRDESFTEFFKIEGRKQDHKQILERAMSHIERAGGVCLNNYIYFENKDELMWDKTEDYRIFSKTNLHHLLRQYYPAYEPELTPITVQYPSPGSLF